MVPSRILFAFADERLVPRILAHVNERFHTPDVGLILTFLVSTFLVVTGTFEVALQTALTAIFLLYVAHGFSALALPWRQPELYEQCSFAFEPWKLALVASFSTLSMVTFVWQVMDPQSIMPALGQLLNGDVGGVTQSPALLVGIWLLVGVIIYAGHTSTDG